MNGFDAARRYMLGKCLIVSGDWGNCNERRIVVDDKIDTVFCSVRRLWVEDATLRCNPFSYRSIGVIYHDHSVTSGS